MIKRDVWHGALAGLAALTKGRNPPSGSGRNAVTDESIYQTTERKRVVVQTLIEVFVYAAALDLYRRQNASAAKGRPALLPRDVSNAMLDIVAWEARPACLQ